jgi:hypothetical protein
MAVIRHSCGQLGSYGQGYANWIWPDVDIEDGRIKTLLDMKGGALAGREFKQPQRHVKTDLGYRHQDIISEVQHVGWPLSSTAPAGALKGARFGIITFSIRWPAQQCPRTP